MGCLFGTQKVILIFKWKNKKPMANIRLKKKVEVAWGKGWDQPSLTSDFI